MITLYQLPPAWGLSSMSPFCAKVEIYLRLAQIPYQTKNITNLSRAPKGKLPYVVDGELCIADSAFIIEYLEKKHGSSLDAHLSARERAVALAWRRLIEEHFYWCGLYFRWMSEEGWKIVEPLLFGKVPPLVRKTVISYYRRRMSRQLAAQGIGRHTREEIAQLGIENLRALADFLAGQAFAMGERPTNLDATLYAFVLQLFQVPLRSPLQVAAQGMPELERYCERMQGYLLELRGDHAKK